MLQVERIAKLAEGGLIQPRSDLGPIAFRRQSGRREEITMSVDTRLEALDRAVRVSLANGGNEQSDDIVKRAETFDAFLRKE